MYILPPSSLSSLHCYRQTVGIPCTIHARAEREKQIDQQAAHDRAVAGRYPQATRLLDLHCYRHHPY